MPEPAPEPDPTPPSPSPDRIDPSRYVKRVYLGSGGRDSGSFNCASATVAKAPAPAGIGSLQAGGQWDYFRLPDCGNSGSERATWVDTAFTRMQQKDVYEWWQVVDSMATVYDGQAGSTHSVRQMDSSLSSGCGGGGNGDNIALSIGRFNSPLGAKRWGVSANGGPDGPCAGSARHYPDLDAGAVQVGEVVHWRVEVLWRHDASGYARIWKDGRLVDPDGDGYSFRGPLGFRLALDGSDISSAALRLQHGFYRHPANTATWVERTSGFGFLE